MFLVLQHVASGTSILPGELEGKKWPDNTDKQYFCCSSQDPALP